MKFHHYVNTNSAAETHIKVEEMSQNSCNIWCTPWGGKKAISCRDLHGCFHDKPQQARCGTLCHANTVSKKKNVTRPYDAHSIVALPAGMIYSSLRQMTAEHHKQEIKALASSSWPDLLTTVNDPIVLPVAILKPASSPFIKLWCKCSSQRWTLPGFGNAVVFSSIWA